MSDLRRIPVLVETVQPPERRNLRRVVRAFGWTCVWLGLFLLGFVVHQLFVTTWFAQQNNAELAAEATEYFATAEVSTVEYATPDTVPDAEGGDSDGGAAGTDDPVEPPTLLVEPAPPEGEPFAIIRIPRLERLRDGWTVVEGVSRRDLKNGAGHMPTTPLPGQPGNAVISGHRTTYGAPFHDLDRLEPGDIIEVETAIGVHEYAVRESTVVRPTEFWVIEDREGAWLTLTTCHPRFSARQRLIVFAELVGGPNADAIVG